MEVYVSSRRGRLERSSPSLRKTRSNHNFLGQCHNRVVIGAIYLPFSFLDTDQTPIGYARTDFFPFIQLIYIHFWSKGVPGKDVWVCQ